MPVSRRIWNSSPWPPRCSICGEKMKRPGALVFSPPWAQSHRVSKTHLCVGCYDDVQKFMADRCLVVRQTRSKKKRRSRS
jgi:hypothetical protein